MINQQTLTFKKELILNNFNSQINSQIKKYDLPKLEESNSVFLNYLRQRVLASPQNALILIIGETGSGKSYAGISLLYHLNKKHFLNKKPYEALKERIAFTPQRFLEIIDKGNLQKGDVIIFDEPQVNYNSREFMSETNKLLNKLITTYRYRQLITIFCTPSKSFIDSQARKIINISIEMKLLNAKEGFSIGKPYIHKNLDLFDECKYIKIRYKDRKDYCVKILNTIKFKRLPLEIEMAYKSLSENFKKEIQTEVFQKIKKECQGLTNKPSLSLLEKEIIKLKISGATIYAMSNNTGLPVRVIRKTIKDMRKKGIVWGRKYLKELLSD